MATRRIGNININYTIPEAQTQLYNAIGRTSGAQAASQQNANQGGGDNFFVKRGKSIENALGTTAASVASLFKSGIDGLGGPEGSGSENLATQQMRKDNKQSMNDIAKKYGYNTWADWQDAYAAARESGDSAKVAEMGKQLKEFQAQANTNANKANEKAAAYKDYTENNYVSKKINQDPGKFAGSAINTLSTAVDVTGLTANPLGNAVQGGVEGLADELEQNGLQDFSWERAGQNALIGATTGAVTGGLNKGLSNALAKRAAAKGLTNTAVKSGLGNTIKQGAKTIAGGAARGALSGAVGGATGAGLQSALNGVEFGQGVQNALQGAVQGAQQGAVTGGIMAGANMAISKTPGVGKFYNELQSAKTNWDRSGSNFDERLTNTLTSTDKNGKPSSFIGKWLTGKKQSNVLGSVGNLGNRVQDVSGINSEALDQFDQAVDPWDRVAQEAGYNNYDEVIQRYMEANPDVQLNPRGAAGQILTWLDQNPNTPTTASEWAKRAGQRIVEDINNSNLGMRVRDVNQDMPDDIRNMNIRDYNTNADGENNGISDRIRNALRSSDGRAANILKNMPGRLGDKYNDWIAEPAQIDEFGPRYSQFSGDPEAARDYLMRRQQGEVPRASYNQSLQDINGDGFIDYTYGVPGEGELYSGGRGLSHIQAKHGDLALNRVPYNTENGTVEKIHDDRVYLQNGDNNDRTVVRTNWIDNNTGETIKKQWLATNYDKNSPASRGATISDSPTAGSSVVSDTGDAPVNRIIPQNVNNVNNDAQTRLYNELTSKKSNTENRLRNAAGLKLQAQYGTIDKPTAKATNAPETLQKIAKAGFTKPADVERMADVVTGSNGEVSKLVSNLVETAKPINTFNGETDSQTMDDFIDLAIQKRGLDGINEGKAVKSQLKAIMKSLPSHADGSITFVDNPTDVFKLTQLLDSEAANYEGRSGMNYGTTTPDKLRAAQVMKDVSNLYKNRIYDTVDVKKVLTPEVAENLKSYAPGNAEWAKYVDDEIMTATSAKDLRSVQAPWVRAKKIIDNGYMNSVTYGGRNSGLTGNIPLTKRGIVGAVLGATVNSKPGLRAQAKVLNKAADFVGGTQPDTTTAPANPVVASPAELANATANYNPSTQLYNAIGRTEGLSNADQVRTASYITEATQDAQAGYAEPLGVSTTTPASTSIYNSLYQEPTTTQEVVATAPGSYFQPTGDYWTDILARAVSSAIDANDVTAFSSLYGMYQDAVSGLQKQAQTTNTSNLNATQQANLAKLDAADSAIDELEDLFENAGGGKGPIVGNLQSLAGDWGWDSGARTYNDMSEGLVNQIAAAIGKTDSLNTEGEVRRALKLIPQLTDDATTAKNKLEELRRMLATTKASYNSAYGLVQ